jgi:hypothetical protein
VETPGDKAAFKKGRRDGLANAAPNPLGSGGFQFAQSYASGYQSGLADAKAKEQEAAQPPYSGPTIGPAPSPEESRESDADHKAQEFWRDKHDEWIEELKHERPEED